MTEDDRPTLTALVTTAYHRTTTPRERARRRMILLVLEDLNRERAGLTCLLPMPAHPDTTTAP